MDISLRRARRLEMSLRGLSVRGQTALVRIYDDSVASADLNKAVDAMQSNIDEALVLNELRYHIRNQINIKNLECGISELLNNKDCLYDEKRILESMVAPDDTAAQLKYVRQLSGANIQLVAVRQNHYDFVIEQLHDITRRLDEISDSLATLNNDTHITLDEEDVNLLKANGLL